MSETHSKSRQLAEIAFANAQSQFLARSNAPNELDAEVLARDAKTARLREARLAKQAEAANASIEKQKPTHKN